MRSFIHSNTSGASPNTARSCRLPWGPGFCWGGGTCSQPCMEELGQHHPGDLRGHSGAVPGPALPSWSSTSPNPDPSPCAGGAPGCPIPTPHPELCVRGAIPHFHAQGTGKSWKGVDFGAGWGRWVLRVPGRRRELPVTARLHLPGHARVTPDALEVPCSNFNFIVSQSFSGSS